CPALLPLANRVVLEHALLNVASAGIRDIVLVISHQADRIESHFGNGAMWGVRIRYILSRGEENPDTLLARVKDRLQLPFVALRGDLFHTVAVGQFVDRGNALASPLVECRADGRNIGMCLVKQLSASLNALQWPLSECSNAADPVVDLPGLISKLDGPREYLEASVKLLDADAPGLALPGRAFDQELRIERHSRVNPRSLETGSIVIGENTLVRDSARLRGPCVIGRNCLVDEMASIHNSIVLPDTYLGKGLLVENSIVSGNLLIRTDRDSIVKISDRHVLSDVAQEMSALQAQLPESLIAGLLLLMSIPLWPLVVLSSVLRSPRRPGQWRYVRNNRSRFFHPAERPCFSRAWFWSSEIPLFRHISLLYLVIRGDLRLFGASIQADVQHQTDTAPGLPGGGHLVAAGLIGPAQLYLAAGTPDEEISLNEIEFSTRRGPGTLVRRLLGAAGLLFSSRAWRAAKTPDSRC
ncbi:MAG: NDP-sugar synthase, partial [Gammaproteobacteria bacterium]|nr:NDP-sugar synthase [Gammaproteobacteria bacterium]